MSDLVERFERAVNAASSLHGQYMGKEMPDAAYEVFTKNRDELVPARRAELRAALEAATWRPISTAPKNEGQSFLVYRDIGLEMSFAMQVSVFEGGLYPDHLCGNVDWSDRVTDATHWMPLTTPGTARKASNE